MTVPPEVTPPIRLDIRRYEELGPVHVIVWYDNGALTSRIGEDLAEELAQDVEVATAERTLLAGPEVFQIVVTGLAATGGFTSMAAAMRAYFRRHADKEFTVSNGGAGGKSVSIKGMDLTDEQMDRLLNEVLGDEDDSTP